MDSYFALLSLSFVENNHMSIFTTFAKQSMINRLSNPINRNRSAVKFSKVMSSSHFPLSFLVGRRQWEGCRYLVTEPEMANLLGILPSQVLLLLKRSPNGLIPIHNKTESKARHEPLGQLSNAQASNSNFI